MISPEDAYEICGMIHACLPEAVSKHFNIDNVRDLLNENDGQNDDGLMPVESAIEDIQFTLMDAFTYADVEAVVKRLVPDRNVMYIYDNDDQTGYTVVFDDNGVDMQIATKLEDDE